MFYLFSSTTLKNNIYIYIYIYIVMSNYNTLVTLNTPFGLFIQGNYLYTGSFNNNNISQISIIGGSNTIII